jgi:hypothetical protein
MFSMQPSIPVSQDAYERLRLLHEVNTRVRSVYSSTETRCKRMEPSTAPHFVRGDNVSIFTSNLFPRGQTNYRKRKDRQLGPFIVEEHIGKHIYILKLPATIRLHNVFHHMSSLRPCSTEPLRPVVPVNVPQGDDDEFGISHIFVVCIKSLHGRPGKNLLFMTHFGDDDIPRVWHRLHEVHRTMALQDFLETPQWHKFAKTNAYIDFMHAHPARIHESQ